MEKYSQFGLAFRKQLLAKRGARPVFYAPLSSSNSLTTPDFTFLEELRRLEFEVQKLTLPDSPLSKEKRLIIGGFFSQFSKLQLQVVGFMKFFDAETTDTAADNFYIEREWRLLGSLRFQIDEVLRIILPLSYAKQIRLDLPEYYGQITFSDQLV